MNNTPQHKDTTLDEALHDLYKRGHKCAAAGYISKDDEDHSVNEAKQALLQWRDKAVVEARIDEVNKSFEAYGLDRKQLRTNIPRDDTIYTSQRIAELKAELKETPNED